MKVNIFGVGKSGTTMLYAGLQKIMDEQFGAENVRYQYEPFLRDPCVIGGPIEDVMDRFALIESLSPEGIFNHVSLPMLIDDPIKFKDNTYIPQLFGARSNPKFLEKLSSKFSTRQVNDKHHVLAKYIRASGRYRLIELIGRPTASIFIIRNPVDTANSIRSKFSFYGGEFHKDDTYRFVVEVNDHFGTDYSTAGFENHIDSQLFFWYYSNRFALESFEKCSNRPLLICYEELVKTPGQHLKAICEHCDLDYKPAYNAFFEKSVGPVTHQKSLAQSELNLAADYLGEYLNLLDDHSISHTLNPVTIIDSYSISETEVTASNNYGLHARALTKRLDSLQRSIKRNSRPTSPSTTPKNKAATPDRFRFTHLVNPVAVDKNSDLFIAQPITFESMKNAKAFADLQGTQVRQVVANYPEDESFIPSFFERCKALESSAVDFHPFKAPRKLPLFADLLGRLDSFEDTDYVIYTNVDIGLMPHFYTCASKLMEKGFDAAMIHRRTLDPMYKSTEDLSAIYSDFGEDHPGTDCFILRAGLARKFELHNIVIGAEFCAFALRANIYAFASKIEVFPKLHMTFHIGDDRVWEDLDEYSSYNANEVDRMFETLLARPDIPNRKKLKALHSAFQLRKRVWKERRQISENTKVIE